MRQQFVPLDLAARSLETFGLEDRLLLLQEEAGELGVAISHFRRGRCGAWQEVMEELADVLVVAEQVCACQGVAEDVASQARGKVARLESLLAQPGYPLKNGPSCGP